MEPIKFDASEPNALEIVRQALLMRLRLEPTLNQIGTDSIDAFFRYLEVKERDYRAVQTMLRQVFWDFIIQGVIVPGAPGNPNLPFFQLTEYGRKVVATGEYLPHDPTGYLERLRKSIPDADDTVVAYLAESLKAFQRDVLIGSTVMLGVAAERVFLLLCESLANALKDSAEELELRRLLKQNAMKPKLEWVLNKFRNLQSVQPRLPLPDNINVMITVVYDLLRVQRNDFGHPRELPPQPIRGEVFTSLNLFPTYYGLVEKVRQFLSQNRV